MKAVSRLRTHVPSVVEDLGSRKLFAAINIVGTAGADSIDLAIVGSAVQVNFNGTVTNYTSVPSISISGGNGDDDIDVDASITLGCVISGNSGNDSISGGAGPDQMTGNDGNDTISGNYGRDTISGNAGDDWLYGNAQSDVIYGGTGSDQMFPGSGGNAVYQNDGANTPDYTQDVCNSMQSNYGNDTFYGVTPSPDGDFIFYLINQ